MKENIPQQDGRDKGGSSSDASERTPKDTRQDAIAATVMGAIISIGLPLLSPSILDWLAEMVYKSPPALSLVLYVLRWIVLLAMIGAGIMGLALLVAGIYQWGTGRPTRIVTEYMKSLGKD